MRNKSTPNPKSPSRKPTNQKPNQHRKPMRKRAKDPLEGIPKFMIPKLRKTEGGNWSISETGGIRGSTGIFRLSGSSLIYCAKSGSPRKPIYTFEKQSFECDDNVDKHSLLFKVLIGDYIIMESHRNHLDGDSAGIINIIAYQIKRNYSKTKGDEPILIPVFQFFRRLNDDSEFSQHFQKSIISSEDSVLIDAIVEELKKKKLEKLQPAIEAAIFRANVVETTYAYYRGSKIANGFSKL